MSQKMYPHDGVCKSRRERHCLFQAVACGLAIGLTCWAVSAQAALPAPKPTASWQTPQVAEVKAEAIAWLDATKPSADVRTKAEQIWSGFSAGASEDELLFGLARTFALVNPKAATLVTLCSGPRGGGIVPVQAWLHDGSVPPLVANNLRLLFGRWLVEQSLYDEALEQVSGLKPSDVVAPASLLFYQSVVYHSLLNKESGLKAIDVLLQGADAVPRRYVALAQLMQSDLKDLEEDTLDHIARRMEDTRRRLDLGRAGPKVRKVEKGIIDSLDKMIKRLEEEQKQQEASNSGNTRSARPADASRIIDGKGRGEVTKKDIGSKSGWGDLPPKEREAAMQQIGRDFPAHYRDAIEQYFRRLAAEEKE